MVVTDEFVDCTFLIDDSKVVSCRRWVVGLFVRSFSREPVQCNKKSITKKGPYHFVRSCCWCTNQKHHTLRYFTFTVKVQNKNLFAVHRFTDKMTFSSFTINDFFDNCVEPYLSRGNDNEKSEKHHNDFFSMVYFKVLRSIVRSRYWCDAHYDRTRRKVPHRRASLRLEPTYQVTTPTLVRKREREEEKTERRPRRFLFGTPIEPRFFFYC